MDTRRAVNDWEVRCNAQVGVAVGAALGGVFFTFYSESLGGSKNVIFSGLGRGLGLSLNAVSIPVASSSEQERRMAAGVRGVTRPRQGGFSRIQCLKSFSLRDLHNSFGKVASAGAGLVLGGGLLEIEGGNPLDPLFKSGTGIGLSVGVGASAVELVGIWKVDRLD